mmetsp:Transcript_25940/g.78172  ORF Transcript_25940/g.78172 Transcript_25940/m.78172 type:complete len:334 (+) Transcript_25940:315-1316(+)
MDVGELERALRELHALPADGDDRAFTKALLASADQDDDDAATLTLSEFRKLFDLGRVRRVFAEVDGRVGGASRRRRGRDARFLGPRRPRAADWPLRPRVGRRRRERADHRARGDRRAPQARRRARDDGRRATAHRPRRPASTSNGAAPACNGRVFPRRCRRGRQRLREPRRVRGCVRVCPGGEPARHRGSLELPRRPAGDVRRRPGRVRGAGAGPRGVADGPCPRAVTNAGSPRRSLFSLSCTSRPGLWTMVGYPHRSSPAASAASRRGPRRRRSSACASWLRWAPRAARGACFEASSRVKAGGVYLSATSRTAYEFFPAAPSHARRTAACSR